MDENQPIDPIEDAAQKIQHLMDNPSEPEDEILDGDDEPEDASASDEAEENSEDDSDEDQQEPAIEPPVSWSGSDVETFKALPREAQEVILRREQARDVFVMQRAEKLANEAKEVESLKSQYVGQLETLLAAITPQEPDRSLIQTDPVAYLEQKAAYDAAIAGRQTVQAEIQKERDASTKAEQARHQEFVQEQAKILAEKLPDIVDPKKGPELYRKITGFAQSVGYTPDQLSWASASDIMILRDAMLWREQSTAAPKVQKTLSNLPKVTKPGAAPAKRSNESQRYQNDLKQLRQSGSVADAARVLSRHIK